MTICINSRLIVSLLIRTVFSLVLDIEDHSSQTTTDPLVSLVALKLCQVVDLPDYFVYSAKGFLYKMRLVFMGL